MDTAAIVFTVEELAALAQAAETFAALLAKIKAAAPDAWPSVVADFGSAAAAFGALPASDFKAPAPAAVATGADALAVGSHVQAAPVSAVQETPESVTQTNAEIDAIVNASGQLPGMPESLTNVSLDHPSTLTPAEPEAAVQEVPPATDSPESVATLAEQLAQARALLAAHPGE